MAWVGLGWLAHVHPHQTTQTALPSPPPKPPARHCAQHRLQIWLGPQVQTRVHSLRPSHHSADTGHQPPKPPRQTHCALHLHRCILTPIGWMVCCERGARVARDPTCEASGMWADRPSRAWLALPAGWCLCRARDALRRRAILTRRISRRIHRAVAFRAVAPRLCRLAAACSGCAERGPVCIVEPDGHCCSRRGRAVHPGACLRLGCP